MCSFITLIHLLCPAEAFLSMASHALNGHPAISRETVERVRLSTVPENTRKDSPEMKMARSI